MGGVKYTPLYVGQPHHGQGPAQHGGSNQQVDVRTVRGHQGRQMMINPSGQSHG